MRQKTQDDQRSAVYFNQAEGTVDNVRSGAWDGTAGAEMRMFLDSNGNGRCDSNEAPVD